MGSRQAGAQQFSLPGRWLYAGPRRVSISEWGPVSPRLGFSPLRTGAGQGQAGHLDPCQAGWGSWPDFSPYVKTRTMGQSPAGPAGSGVAMVRRAAVPGAHPPGAPALEVQGASLASQEEVSFLDIATRQHLPSRLLRGFRRGFHVWGNPGLWKTLENSGLLAQLPFLSVHGSISRNTQFHFSQWAWEAGGGEK